jgi:hypothetical protein
MGLATADPAPAEGEAGVIEGTGFRGVTVVLVKPPSPTMPRGMDRSGGRSGSSSIMGVVGSGRGISKLLKGFLRRKIIAVVSPSGRLSRSIAF